LKQRPLPKQCTRPDLHSPFLLWLNKTLPSLLRHLKVEDKPITANADQCPSPIQDKWKDWLSPYIMWIPLTAPGKSINGYLLLVRSTPFTDGDITVMNHLSGAMGQALALEQSIKHITQKSIWQRQNFIKFAMIFSLLCLFFFPIRQFSMAPAEIVPVDPIVIRSPLEGVIKTIHKESNARVLEGNLLFELDQIKVMSQIVQLEQSLFPLRAENIEYIEAPLQRAFTDYNITVNEIVEASENQHKATQTRGKLYSDLLHEIKELAYMGKYMWDEKLFF